MSGIIDLISQSKRARNPRALFDSGKRTAKVPTHMPTKPSVKLSKKDKKDERDAPINDVCDNDKSDFVERQFERLCNGVYGKQKRLLCSRKSTRTG